MPLEAHKSTFTRHPPTLMRCFSYVRCMCCRRQEQQEELGPGVVVGDILQPETWEGELAGCTHLVM
jgi:hypothetical protein